ncbi:hypothetical protein [Aquihabitans sp. McL0605]|uniref:hypothetical protein n=1 Tax=Aquihabitans sp. McL0605 TaxID=3415671 RepID=UPI003CE88B38
MIVGIAVLLVVGLSVTLVKRGSSGDTATGSAPGYDASGPKVSDRPFSLAEPQVTGSTTLPDGVLSPTSSTTAPFTTTTIAPPTTTTTTLPTVPAGDAACQALLRYFEVLAAAPSMRDRTSDLRTFTVDHLNDAVGLLRQAGATTYAPTIAIVQQVIDDARRAATAAALEQATVPLRSNANDVAFAPLLSHAQATCPDLPLA